jgi:hypothetical protein
MAVAEGDPPVDPQNPASPKVNTPPPEASSHLLRTFPDVGRGSNIDRVRGWRMDSRDAHPPGTL